jgi:uncharacterized protein YbgA (DUF1722 family)
MQFHARHKFLLMAHEQAGMRRLGNLIGQAARSISGNSANRPERCNR